MANTKFPFGDADIQSPTFSATLNQTITDTLTVIKVTVTAAITALSLTNGDAITVGSMVKVDITQDATGRNVTFGSAGDTIVAPVLTGVANDSDSIWLTWDGIEWRGGVWEKYVDAA